MEDNRILDVETSNLRWKISQYREAFGDDGDVGVESAVAAAEASTSTSTSPSSDNKSQQKQRPPKPFGFRRFKGHKHDREAALKRAKTEEYLSSGAADADIEAHRTSRREGGVAGASPIDRLLTQASELRKRVGRSVPAAGGGKKK